MRKTGRLAFGLVLATADRRWSHWIFSDHSRLTILSKSTIFFLKRLWAQFITVEPNKKAVTKPAAELSLAKVAETWPSRGPATSKYDSFRETHPPLSR